MINTCYAVPILVMGVLMEACATVPRAASYDEATEQVEMHRCTDICWVMSARNNNYSEARVYINGRRAATLPGLMGKDVAIPIRRSMLDGAGCMVVFVKLYPEMNTAYSSNECPVPGSRLELAIEESNGNYPLRLWLQDWRKR
jgi:hypothetical protein